MGNINRIMKAEKHKTGTEARKAAKEIRIKKCSEYTKEFSNDTKNRDYVVREEIKYIKEGLSEEKALEKLMNDKIVKEFEYLKKNGLDIRNCFKNWINAEIKKPRRKEQRITEYNIK